MAAGRPWGNDLRLPGGLHRRSDCGCAGAARGPGTDKESSVSFHDLREAVADTEHSLAAIPMYPVSMLPASAQALVDASGLPAAFVAASGVAALAGAMGFNVEVEVNKATAWTERPILGIANIGPRGAGKSPAQMFALGPLRDHDAALADDDDEDA